MPDIYFTKYLLDRNYAVPRQTEGRFVSEHNRDVNSVDLLCRAISKMRIQTKIRLDAHTAPHRRVRERKETGEQRFCR
jgi:hypothetical protein